MSTFHIALKTNRKYIYIDKSIKYCKLAEIDLKKERPIFLRYLLILNL